MAIFTDPRTGDVRNLGQNDVRSATSSTWLGILVLLIALAFGGWYFYNRMSPTVGTTSTSPSTVTEPVTTPSSPNAIPTKPAPTP
jgi:drug/metabolite transporter (DMT)-like permease